MNPLYTYEGYLSLVGPDRKGRFHHETGYELPEEFTFPHFMDRALREYTKYDEVPMNMSLCGVILAVDEHKDLFELLHKIFIREMRTASVVSNLKKPEMDNIHGITGRTLVLSIITTLRLCTKHLNLFTIDRQRLHA